MILGPTASGKSDLAMAVAAAIGGEILSVDSMQVYRAMDIGTAKPIAAERTAVVHHGLDLCDHTESFTVARFVEMAERTIADCEARRVPLILTGGTPLYYKSLFEGLFEGPPADEAVRQRLYAEPADVLHRRLMEVDPLTAARLHVNDSRRVVRALEVFELTGRPISDWQTDWGGDVPKHAAAWFGLAWEKEAINRRINARAKQMIDAGWLDETRTLLKAGEFSPTAGEATGYRQLSLHIAGKVSLTDAVERIKIDTRQLARRQMKWFRRFGQVKWLDGTRSVEDLKTQLVAGI